jgi:hypothetical protein
MDEYKFSEELKGKYDVNPKKLNSDVIFSI